MTKLSKLTKEYLIKRYSALTMQYSKKSNCYHILEIDYYLLQQYDICIQQKIKDKIIAYLQQQKQYKDYTIYDLEDAVNYNSLVSQFN